ncbi:hypothetical protein [Pontiella sp.]|uniref:hypothetical protein n=1 Tax=Pontiella sp. TaxID=2837462 RepID=UPI0035651012
MITVKIITVTTIVLFLTLPTHVTAGCNLADGTKYDIDEISGGESVEDGGSITFECVTTPDVSDDVTPMWTLTPEGGGAEGLLKPSISEDGMCATIQFFWHDGDGEVLSCEYELECKTSENCTATKTITVTVAEEASIDISATAQLIPSESNGLYRVASYSSFTFSGDPDYSMYHPDSEFLDKAKAHEEQHYSVFYQGTQTPAAQEACSMIETFLSDTGNDSAPMILSAFQLLRNLTQEYVFEELIGPPGNSTSWAEIEAYAADKLVPPHYFER